MPLFGGDPIYYILKKSKKRRDLIVIFSGFAGHYTEGRYNYYRTLKDVDANLLFIKDDKGYFSVGTYYFGTNCSWKKNSSIEELIEYISCKENLDLFATVGSSKGGYSALYFGLKMNFKYIVSGSPQYRISDYLKSITDEKDPQYGLKILNGITCNDFDDDYINNALLYIINETLNKPIIYLYFSSKEKSFENDVSKLIDDLNAKFELKLMDLLNYEHSYIGTYFKKN